MAKNDGIIEALKNARQAKGLSQRALAARVGLPQSHISKIERGGVDIQLSSLTEIARALELELRLVPRQAMPAVESIIRQAVPAIQRDRQARIHEALSRAAALAERLAEFDDSPALDQIREVARLLQHVPVPPTELEAVQKALAPLRQLEHLSFDTSTEEEISFALGSPKVRRSLKSVSRSLQSVRNRAVHAVASAPPQARPAYQLDEEDGRG